jgi:hypothetical protein
MDLSGSKERPVAGLSEKCNVTYSFMRSGEYFGYRTKY